jgi:hypothetical protein
VARPLATQKSCNTSARGPITVRDHSYQKQASAARRAANLARGRKRGHPRVRDRPIYAGRSSMITRRCLGRLMLLSPSYKGKELREFIGYCLGYAAALYGIQVHASVWMSNHHHTNVTDPHGNLVPFKQLLHSMIARGRNAQLGRHDSFWSGDEACDTRRPKDDETMEDLVYT